MTVTQRPPKASHTQTLIASAATAAFLLVSADASAGVVTFTNANAAFLTAAAAASGNAPVVLEKFDESFTNSGSFTFASGVTASVNNGTLQSSSISTSGLSVAYTNTDATTQFTFTFPQAVVGFAVNILDLQTTGTPSVYLATTTSSSPVQVAVIDQPDGDSFNFGLVNTTSTFTAVIFEFAAFGSEGSGNFIAFDNLQFVVPSPAAAGGGLAMLGMTALRRRKTAVAA